jgi:hypothetical protein
MRTRMVLAIAGALIASTAVADANKEVERTKKAVTGSGKYGLAGCGLGSMAFGTEPGAVQILAATTNALFLSQLFGITTGTSNCQPGAFADGTRNFVEANREALAKDVSRGEGEGIGAITTINACRESRAVGAALQRSFGRIFPSEQATTDEVTEAILETLYSDQSLGCGARG